MQLRLEQASEKIGSRLNVTDLPVTSLGEVSQPPIPTARIPQPHRVAKSAGVCPEAGVNSFVDEEGSGSLGAG